VGGAVPGVTLQQTLSRIQQERRQIADVLGQVECALDGGVGGIRGTLG
jgi:hypothetical protein